MDDNTRKIVENLLQALMLSTVLVLTLIFCKITNRNTKEYEKDENTKVGTLKEACSQTDVASVVTRWKCDVCDTKWRAVSIFNKKIAPPKNSSAKKTYRTELQLEVKGKKKYKPYEVKLQL